MTPSNLPAPLAALIASGRHRLTCRSSGLATALPVVADALRHEGTASATGVSPETLTEYALRHGMVAWAAGPLIDGVLRTHMSRALQGVRLLQEITGHFSGADIDVVALKGPAFSQWLYGNPCARRFVDIDLLVSPTQLAPAVRLLRECGFAAGIPGRSGELVYSSIGALTLARGNDHHLDLHWRLAARRFSPVLDAADLLHEAIQIRCVGAAVRIPRPEHGAALALTHAAKHLWYALELPLSIAMLTGRTDIDWHEVHALMLAGGAVRGAATGLQLAADLFGIEVPPAFRADTRMLDVQELRRCAGVTLALPPRTFPARGLERRMQRLSFDRAVGRVRYDVRRIMEPTRADVEWVRLPPAMTSLYWPLRVVRLGATVAGLSPADPSAG